eukprot:15350518-Ditylum_brightwellii.AAC.2
MSSARGQSFDALSVGKKVFGFSWAHLPWDQVLMNVTQPVWVDHAKDGFVEGVSFNKNEKKMGVLVTLLIAWNTENDTADPENLLLLTAAPPEL